MKPPDIHPDMESHASPSASTSDRFPDAQRIRRVLGFAIASQPQGHEAVWRTARGALVPHGDALRLAVEQEGG